MGIFLLKAAASGRAHVQLFLGSQQAVYWGFEVWQSRYSIHSWNALAHTLAPLRNLHLELKLRCGSVIQTLLCLALGIKKKKNLDEIQHYGFNFNNLMQKNINGLLTSL